MDRSTDFRQSQKCGFGLMPIQKKSLALGCWVDYAESIIAVSGSRSRQFKRIFYARLKGISQFQRRGEKPEYNTRKGNRARRLTAVIEPCHHYLVALSIKLLGGHSMSVSKRNTPAQSAHPSTIPNRFADTHLWRVCSNLQFIKKSICDQAVALRCMPEASQRLSLTQMSPILALQNGKDSCRQPAKLIVT